MKPLQVDFKPSKRFIGLFALAAIAVCIVLATTPVAWQIRASLVLLIIACSAHAILYHGLKCLPASIVSIRVDIKNELYILQRNGNELQVKVAANTTVTPYLIVLNVNSVSSEGWKRLIRNSIVILPDHVKADDLRRLRVWLKWA